MSEHPVVKKAENLSQDIRVMAAQQAAQWEALVLTIAALGPVDGLAETLLRQLANLLASINVNYGEIAGWNLQQRWLIHREASRLLGAVQARENFRAPGWSEEPFAPELTQFSLSQRLKL